MTSTLRLRTPADLLAAVPYMLGFHPADSVVVLGLRRGALVFELRGDLPSDGHVDEFADYYARLVHRQRVDAALLVGYGPGDAVTPAVTTTAAALARHGVAVPEMLRAHEGRYWSYTCTSPSCCPPEGTPYDVSTSPIAAQATVFGCEALPSRAELERRLAPLTGAARTAMRAATRRAAAKLTRLANVPGLLAWDGSEQECSEGDLPGDPARLATAGCAAVDAAVARHRAGGRLDDDELAWLSVVLGHEPVRDHAWSSVRGDLSVHVSLWADVLRRAEPELAAPVATLLGLAAWCAGEGAIASIALARALQTDSTYVLAQLLDHALRHGLSPVEWEAECESARLRARRAAGAAGPKPRRSRGVPPGSQGPSFEAKVAEVGRRPADRGSEEDRCVYTALVLAGGAGQRLGGPGKPALLVGGAPMLARVLAAVAGASARIVVGPQTVPLPDGVLLTREQPPGGGPVAAIAAGLPLVQTGEVVLLAADLPFLTAAAVDHLRATLAQPAEAASPAMDATRAEDAGPARIAEDAGPAVDGVVYVDEAGRRQTLCGVWCTESLRRRVERLRDERGEDGLAGAPLRALLAGLRVGEVTHQAGGPPPWYDCDTQAEWERAEQWARSART